MYFVTVLDSLMAPVDSLQTTITNSRGKEYDFSGILPPYLPGTYYVMTDSYVNDFSTRAEEILFAGNLGGKQVSAEYFFNTDKCHCHVYRISGPDTLVLK